MRGFFGSVKNFWSLIGIFLVVFVFFCVSELVLLCSLNEISVRFGLVLLNERIFMGLCSYILEHVVFDFEFFGCVCIVSMLCLI